MKLIIKSRSTQHSADSYQLLDSDATELSIKRLMFLNIIHNAEELQEEKSTLRT